MQRTKMAAEVSTVRIERDDDELLDGEIVASADARKKTRPDRWVPSVSDSSSSAARGGAGFSGLGRKGRLGRLVRLEKPSAKLFLFLFQLI